MARALLLHRRGASPDDLVLHLALQLAEEHVQTIAVVPAQRFLDALAVIFEVSD
jgi:hypothetical protein